MIRLSIIIPVYNSEKYLTKCLDSLLEQDIPMHETEIIIINDGSTDKSAEIALLYKKKIPNFELISIEKTGVGSARNIGINHLKGNYLFFLDSDDYIRPNCLNNLLSVAEKNNLDLLRFDYESVNEEGEIIPKRKNAKFRRIFNERIVDGETFLTEYLGWACYSWSYLCSSKFIKGNSLHFNPSIYFEDVEWLIKTLLAAQKVLSVNQTVYYYLNRPGSITQSITLKNKAKVFNDKIHIIEFLKETASQSKNKKVIKWINGMISLIIMGLLSYTVNDIPVKIKELARYMRKEQIIPLKSYNFTFKQKRDLLIINVSPRLYCFLKKKW